MSHYLQLYTVSNKINSKTSVRNTKPPGPDLKQMLKSGYSRSYLYFRGRFWVLTVLQLQGNYDCLFWYKEMFSRI